MFGTEKVTGISKVRGNDMRVKTLLVCAILLMVPQSAVQAEVNLIGSLIDYQTSGAAYPPEVSYNAYSNEHMAIWLAYGQLRGRRVNATTGSLVGTEFIVERIRIFG